MKLYHFMDDLSAKRGPVELASLAKMPPDTLVREVGTTKWIQIRFARLRATDVSPPVEQGAKEAAPEGAKPWPQAILMAAVGLLMGSYFLATGSWLYGMILYCFLWAGLAAMVAMGTGQKAKAGFWMGGLLGPAGFLAIAGIGIYKLTNK